MGSLHAVQWSQILCFLLILLWDVISTLAHPLRPPAVRWQWRCIRLILYNQIILWGPFLFELAVWPLESHGLIDLTPYRQYPRLLHETTGMYHLVLYSRLAWKVSLGVTALSLVLMIRKVGVWGLGIWNFCLQIGNFAVTFVYSGVIFWVHEVTIF